LTIRNNIKYIYDELGLKMCSGAAGVPEITNHKIQNNLENNSAFFYIFSILVRKGKRSLKISIINIGKLMKLTRHRTKPVPSEPYPTDNQTEPRKGKNGQVYRGSDFN